MTNNEMLTTYESFSELTDSMLNAAREGEWDHLAALEQRCRSHVGNLMQATSVTLNENEQRTKVAIIRAILQNDAKIRALAEPRLHELQQRLSMTRTGQRSIEAYGSQALSMALRSGPAPGGGNTSSISSNSTSTSRSREKSR